MTLADHTYRLGLHIGVQPGHADVLLAQNESGFPQRFVWFDAHLPADIKMPLGKDLQSWKWATPDDASHGIQFDKEPEHLEVIRVPEFVRQEVILDHIKRGQGHGDELSGHRNLARLKVAAVLMWMDGRTEAISAEDWELAGQIMDHSDLTREQAQEYRNREQSKRADAAAAGRGRRAAIEEAEKEKALISKAKEKILDRLKNGQIMRKSDVLGQNMTNSLRPVAENALDELVKAKKVKVVRSKNPTNNQPVTRLQLIEDN